MPLVFSNQLDGGAAAWAVITKTEDNVESRCDVVTKTGNIVGRAITCVVSEGEKAHVTHGAGGCARKEEIGHAGKHDEAEC